MGSCCLDYLRKVMCPTYLAPTISTFCILTSQSGKWQIMRMMSASLDRRHFIISFEFNWYYCNVVKFGNDTSNLPICANRHSLTWYYLIVMMPHATLLLLLYIFFILASAFLLIFSNEHYTGHYGRYGTINSSESIQERCATVVQFLSIGPQWEQYIIRLTLILMNCSYPHVCI